MDSKVSSGAHTVFNCAVCKTVVCEVARGAKPTPPQLANSEIRDAGQEGTKEWIKKAAEEIEKSNHPNIWSEKAIARYAEVIARHVPASAPVEEASIWPPSIVSETEPDEPVAYLYRVREVGKQIVEFATVEGWRPKDPSKEIIESKLPLYLRPAAPVPERTNLRSYYLLEMLVNAVQASTYMVSDDVASLAAESAEFIDDWRKAAPVPEPEPSPIRWNVGICGNDLRPHLENENHICHKWARIEPPARKDERGTCDWHTWQAGSHAEDKRWCVNWKPVAPQASPEAPAKECADKIIDGLLGYLDSAGLNSPEKLEGSRAWALRCVNEFVARLGLSGRAE